MSIFKRLKESGKLNWEYAALTHQIDESQRLLVDYSVWLAEVQAEILDIRDEETSLIQRRIEVRKDAANRGIRKSDTGHLLEDIQNKLDENEQRMFTLKRKREELRNEEGAEKTKLAELVRKRTICWNRLQSV